MSEFDASPYSVMADIDRVVRLLDKASQDLARAILAHANAQAAYDRRVEQEKLRIFHDYQARSERMPAQDIRDAMAHKGAVGDLYSTMLLNRAQVESLKAWARGLEHGLSGRQSLLSVLKSEARA